jgi:hypothetical protein
MKKDTVLGEIYFSFVFNPSTLRGSLKTFLMEVPHLSL